MVEEKIKIGEAVTVQVIRASRINWTLIITMLFILVVIYFLYKKRGGRMNWKKFFIAISVGVIFMIIASILTINLPEYNTASIIVIGLLIIYLELRFKEEIFFKERRIKK